MKEFAIIVDETNKKRVISSKWLNDELNFMKWPPYKDPQKIARAAINHEVPTNTWEEYSIRFVKDKDDYIDAIGSIKEKIDEDTSDGDKLKKSRSVRKRKRFNEHFQESSKNSKPKDSDDDSTENQDDKTNEKAVSPINNKNSPYSKTSRVDISEDEQQHLNNDGEEEDFEPKSNKMATSLPSTSKEAPACKIIATEEILATPISGEDKISAIYAMMVKNSVSLNFIKSRINNIDNKLEKITTMTANGFGRDEGNVAAIAKMGKYFPIISAEAVDDIEKKLEKSSFFWSVEKAVWRHRSRILKVKFMKSKGGSNAHDLTYNILAAVMANELACEYSFYGQKKKKKFKDLMLASCISMAVKAAHKNATDDNIIQSIKMWLDNSFTRVSRAKKALEKQGRKAFVPVVPEDGVPSSSSVDSE